MKPWCNRMQQRADGRNVGDKRMTGVVLNPLAEIGIGMFMSVVVRRRQFVMNGERGRKRRNRHQEQRQRQRNRCPGLDSAMHTGECDGKPDSHTGNDY